MRHPEQPRRPEDIHFLSDPEELPPPFDLVAMPSTRNPQWVLKVPNPNAWHRFWTRVLLGWRWERR
jgi:hypothetical protein